MSVDNFFLFSGTTVLNYPEIRPSLNLNFARTKTLDPRITFTRGSGGSYIDANGLIKYAGINEARFDHDPITGESLGLLIEESRTNFIQQSEPSANSSRWLFRNLHSRNDEINGPSINGIKITPQKEQYPPIQPVGGPLTSWAGFETNQIYPNWTSTPSLTVKHRVSFMINPLSWDKEIFLHSYGYDGNPDINIWVPVLLFNDGKYVGPLSYIKHIYPDGTYWLHNIPRPINVGSNFRLGFSVTQRGDNAKSYWVSAIQMELGPPSIPLGSTPDPVISSSYIPTTTASRTRAADVVRIIGDNFSQWFNPNQGTTFVDCITRTNNQNAGVVTFDDSVVSSYIAFRRQSATWRYYVPRFINLTSVNSFSNKACFAYSTSDYAISTNGTPPQLNPISGLPTGLNRMLIGNHLVSGQTGYLNGTISRLIYWPQRLSNSTLQTLNL
jgi:hypothetical protein